MLSVITINYNDKLGLAKTISSVKAQYPAAFEHLVIDGDSTDGSKELLADYKEPYSRCYSAPDTGIYNAMNKGIALAKGNYLLFLNSADSFYESDTLSKAQQHLDGTHDLVYGDIVFDRPDRQMLFEYPNTLDFAYFAARSLGHPATLIKASLFEKLGPYKEHLKICADWEFFIRAICLEKVAYKHIEQTITLFDMSGVSNQPEYQRQIAAEKQEVFRTHFKKHYLAFQRQNNNTYQGYKKWISWLKRIKKGS